MRKSKFMLSSWLTVVATMLVSGVATAQAAEGANAANGQKIFTQGKGDAVTACVTCHGDKAQGNDAMGAPRLADIGYGYVVKQLTDLAEGRRTPAGVGAVMPGFAKALTPQERRDVSAYVNSLKTTPELSDLKALKEQGQQVGVGYKGQEIVTEGIVRNGFHISACTSCHSYNGRGADPIFPRIGEQKYVYLINQLHNWRHSEADVAAGTIARTNDPGGMMQAIAKNLTDEDILNVATYLSSAPPVKGAGDTIPENDSLLHNVNK